MKKQAKRDWLKALRSGEYEQTQGALCTIDGKMCCLGVLVDACVDGEWVLSGDFYSFDRHHGALPTSVGVAVGLNEIDETTLISMNDHGGKSFAEIADWVEENL